MGYYAYQSGLIYNHLNQEGGWDSHLANCREFIKRAVGYFKPGTVTIVGSGWLLDLPLAELLEETELIYLVDIIHPPEVVKQAGGLENVTLRELDVTGGLIEAVWNATRKSSIFKKPGSLESIVIPEFLPDFDPGFVISLNIMTQLESQLINYLRKRAVFSEDELFRFRREIQVKHLEFLKKHRSVLITDYAEVVSRKSGEVTTIPSLFVDLPEGYFRNEWTWDFDLRGHENYTSRSVIKVVSVAL